MKSQRVSDSASQRFSESRVQLVIKDAAMRLLDLDGLILLIHRFYLFLDSADSTDSTDSLILLIH